LGDHRPQELVGDHGQVADGVDGLPRLIVLRGNSGSGKSTIARELRRLHPGRFVWLEQDNFRRIVIDEDGLAQRPLTAEMIDRCARLALGSGRDVIVEGILDASRYGAMLRALRDAYPSSSEFFYFSISFDETVRRHATRPLADAFGPEDMAAWYREDDRLTGMQEYVIDEHDSLEQILHRIQAKTVVGGTETPHTQR
jgi:predicted kinase